MNSKQRTILFPLTLVLAAILSVACGEEGDIPCEELLAECYEPHYLSYMNSHGGLGPYISLKTGVFECQDTYPECGKAPHEISLDGVDLSVTLTSTSS